MKSLCAWWNSLHEATQIEIITVVAVVVTVLLAILFGAPAPKH
jgi:hypothetical protein